MLNQSIAVIGAGVMGGALCRGLLESGACAAESIRVSDAHPEHLKSLSDSCGVRTCLSNAEAADGADIVVLAVKPQTVTAVLNDITPVITPEQLIITIAAGVRTATVGAALCPGVPIIRAMPNTAAQIRQGACAYCKGEYATHEHMEAAREIFSSFGTAVEVDERMMDAVTGLSGSGPAYVYLMIEAMVDGGVKAGLPRDLAHQLAAQTVLGAARMVIETGKHPAQLKDMVATPSGTTITALAALEQSGFRAALIDAVERAAIRSAELGR